MLCECERACMKSARSGHTDLYVRSSRYCQYCCYLPVCTREMSCALVIRTSIAPHALPRLALIIHCHIMKPTHPDMENIVVDAGLEGPAALLARRFPMRSTGKTLERLGENAVACRASNATDTDRSILAIYCEQ